jgi:hypothetical protein
MNDTPVRRHRVSWLPTGWRTRHILVGLAAGLLLAGCAAADKNASSDSGSSGMSGMARMNVGSSGATKVPEVNGIKPVPIQTLATSYWQGMEIQA